MYEFVRLGRHTEAFLILFGRISEVPAQSSYYKYMQMKAVC